VHTVYTQFPVLSNGRVARGVRHIFAPAFSLRMNSEFEADNASRLKTDCTDPGSKSTLPPSLLLQK